MNEVKTSNRPPLNYAFARAQGVLAMTQEGELVIARRPGATLEALLEARRAIGQPAKLIDVTPGEFESHAARVYAQADLSSSAEDAIDTPGDLNALASGLPRTSDLLDSTDDAPVIRLINGILQEAIRSRASDIHIEPYEPFLCGFALMAVCAKCSACLPVSPRFSFRGSKSWRN